MNAFLKRVSVTGLKLIALIAASMASGMAVAQQAPEAQLRLKPGNYWVYAGQIAWSDVTTKTYSRTKAITWKTQIVEEVTRGPLKAYLVRGSFDDLAWPEPGDKPDAYHLWVVYRNRFYSLVADKDLLRRFRNPKDSLISAVVKEEPVLQFPARLNQCTVEVQPEEPRDRQDMMYCWHLEQKRMRKLKAAGVSADPVAEWTAWYRTNPDHQILGFAPGIGIISYDFSHHGSVSEAHVKLIRAHLE
jgi:hypothetical protein